MTDFNLDHFWRFCSTLRVDTKERGAIFLKPENLMGTQRYFVEEMAKGLQNGIHTFVVLKGRQLGISTISLALDLYWVNRFNGMNGTLITHNEEARNMFKTTLGMYLSGLPKKYRHKIENHNRTELVLGNRSRLAYQVAGTRRRGTLGRGTAITFMHSTETSSYGDEEGIASLKASLAEHNPNRLYIYESTARGYNGFCDMWETAEDAVDQSAIFVGWWRNEYYAVDRKSKIFETYWDGKHTPTEQKWIREVKKMYDYDIRPEQIAWWRWKVAEVIQDETLAYQEFPHTEEYAFVLSGTNFFNLARVNDEYKKARESAPDYYRFVFRDNFEDCELAGTNPKTANMLIWEAPKGGAYYAVGADPAYGSSDWADRFCIQVFRCYADGLEQVAEFNTSQCTTYQFAWVIAYLCGAYRGAKLNLEINGPGQAVFTELMNMKRMAATAKSKIGQGLFNVLSAQQNFLYGRVDSFAGPSAFHWKSNTDAKERMLNFFKDHFERGTLLIRNPALLDEMKNIIREDGILGAPGRGKDDRVIAAGLASMSWEQIRMNLVRMGITKQNRDVQVQNSQVFNVQNYLKQMGVFQNARR